MFKKYGPKQYTMYCIKAQIIAKRQQIFVRSATDVQRRQQQRKPHRVGGVAGGAVVNNGPLRTA